MNSRFRQPFDAILLEICGQDSSMSVTTSKNAQSYRVAGRKSIGPRGENSVAALQRVYFYSSPVLEMLGRKGWLDAVRGIGKIGGVPFSTGVQ